MYEATGRKAGVSKNVTKVNYSAVLTAVSKMWRGSLMESSLGGMIR